MRTDRSLHLGTALAVAVLTATTSTSSATAGAAPAPGGPTCLGRAATIVGTDGDDRLTGTRGADVVVARAGDDVVDGRGGDDLICGGAGEDTVSYASSRAAVTGDLAGATRPIGAVVRTGDDRDRVARVEVVAGSPLADELRSGRAYLQIDGGPGDDRLVGVDVDGGLGDDLLTAGLPGQGNARGTGGPGDDVVTVVGKDGFVLAGRGNDEVTAVGLGASLGDGPGDDTVTFERTGFLQPGPGDDLVVGSPGDDRLDVAAGDVVRGRAGDDTFSLRDGTVPTSLDGGAGLDTVDAVLLARREEPGTLPVVADFVTGRLTYDDGATSLTGTEAFLGPRSQPSTVTGTERDERFETGCQDDHVDAGGGDDVVVPHRGDDVVDLGEGDDRLSEYAVGCGVRTSSDDDRYVAGPGTDLFVAALPDDEGSSAPAAAIDLAAGTATVSGVDTLAGFENVFGSAGDEVLRGDDGPNLIRSQGGDDRLFGRAGDDRLVQVFTRTSRVRADGGAGTDACLATVEVRCETDLD